MPQRKPSRTRPAAQRPAPSAGAGRPAGSRRKEPRAADDAQLMADLAARVAALEQAARSAPAARVPGPEPASGLPEAGRYWILDRLARTDTRGGEIAYAGSVTTPTGAQYLWQRQAAAGALFEQDWTGLTTVLAALGHPVRLQLLHHLLHGRTTKAELERIPGLGTTGQLYHHLRALQEAGWVRSLERGTYGVPGERVVPLLAILTACAG